MCQTEFGCRNRLQSKCWVTVIIINKCWIPRWVVVIALQILGICHSNPCANKDVGYLLLFTLSLLFPSLHLHLFCHNRYKCEEHVQFNLIVEIWNLNCMCIEHAQKHVWRFNSLTCFGVHHKGRKQSPTSYSQWNYQNDDIHAH